MRVKGWSGRSGLAKVDLYTRGTVYLIVWTAVLGQTLLLHARPVHEGRQLLLVMSASLLAVAEGVLCGRLARHAMDAYLGQGHVPRSLVSRAAAVTAATTAAVVALAATVDLAGLLAAGLAPFLTVHCLLVRNRTTALVQLAVLAVVGGLVALTGRTAAQVLFAVVTTGFVTGWMAFTARASMWVLAVMWELREARDVQARLAVAEERLRFGRDLHDVLGRNLAVIALKSELAVQLARRARPEAVDQMTEVQRIAQESHREVRDVVRGYREADLRVEVEGARGVLAAAGIACTVEWGRPNCPAMSSRRWAGWSGRPRRTCCGTGTRGAARSRCAPRTTPSSWSSRTTGWPRRRRATPRDQGWRACGSGCQRWAARWRPARVGAGAFV